MRYFLRHRMPRPEALYSARAEQLRREMDEYLRYAAEVSQQRRAPIDRKFLMEPEIRRAVAEGFRGACAYCESPMVSGETMACHHRPPGLAADQYDKTDILHYVWLAYEWDNLYLVCDVCNHGKANRFPVRQRRGELRSSIGQLREQEGELLLDPCFHDPGEHLNFLASGVVAPRTEEGHVTIDTLNLNRLPLVESRRAAYSNLRPHIIGWNFLEVRPTGASSGWGREIIAGTQKLVIGHAGAATLALQELALKSDFASGSLSELFAKLARQMPGDREGFLRNFGKTAPAEPAAPPTPASPPVAIKTRAARAPRPSRAFRLHDHPLAKLPIAEVAIRDFKTLKEIVFSLPVSVDDPELTPSMLILGENAAGKSSVLEAIALALLGTEEIEALDRLVTDEEITPRDLAHRPDPENFDIVAPGPVSVEIRYHGADQVSRIEGRVDQDRFEGSAETAKILLAYGPRRFFASRPTRRFRAPARRVRSLFDPMDTIANPFDWLLSRDQAEFDAAARALREILMLETEAEFRREEGRILIDTEAGIIPMSELSVGYKSVIAMATDIMRELMYHYDNLEYAQAVVIIHEIENHLHPRWKMHIVDLLRRAFPKAQFLITTHDPLCLRGLYKGEVFVLRRNPDDRRVETLVDLPDVRGMRAEQILMSEFFGLGSTDPETDAKLMRYHHLVTTGGDRPEVERLRAEIESTMMVGDTMQDQVVAEAMRKANIDPIAPLGKVSGDSRKAMVTNLLGSINELLDSQKPGGDA